MVAHPFLKHILATLASCSHGHLGPLQSLDHATGAAARGFFVIFQSTEKSTLLGPSPFPTMLSSTSFSISTLAFSTYISECRKRRPIHCFPGQFCPTLAMLQGVHGELGLPRGSGSMQTSTPHPVP